MAPFDQFYSIPVGAMFALVDDQDWKRHLEALSLIPQSLHFVIGDPKIGAYLRGLATSNGLSVEQSAQIAQVVLEVVTGMVAPDQLQSALQKRCGCSTEVAGSMAREIEKELFAPVALELNKYWQGVAGESDDLAL